MMNRDGKQGVACLKHSLPPTVLSADYADFHRFVHLRVLNGNIAHNHSWFH